LRAFSEFRRENIMRIAAVVVTHNRPGLLQQVIAALQAQTRALDCILVVDNASDEPTRTLLAQLDGIVVLRTEANLGGAGGFARGMQQAYAAGFDWIWLMDDDAIPRADALARLEDAAGGVASTAGAVCGAVREFGDIALAHRRSYGHWTGLERQLPRHAYRAQAVRVDTGSFVGFMVAAHAIARVGLPEPAFFLAYDDTEYSLRLRRAGLAIWLVPHSIVDHMRAAQGRLRAGPFGRKHYFNIRNRIVVASRYASLPVVPACGTALFGAALWLACAGRFRRTALAILLQALRDGFGERLGPYPAALERLETGSQEDAAVPAGPRETL
jgi:rhamnopyranosyl-N-acetylglucosaminyl-diphospho-decaprenol beta-1,3/1,4-galactofuranosyltransferase